MSREIQLWKEGYLPIGVDEVGRGALSGPVYVGAACVKPEFNPKKIGIMETLGIDDSKKLSPHKREELTKIIKKISYWSVAKSSVACINTYGIVKAVQRAASKAIQNVIKQLAPSGKTYILADAFPIPGYERQTAIIHGDALVLSIAAASIIAKVERDRYMVKLSQKHPKYHWDRNKGYGTKEHIKALTTYGPTPHHRTLYIRHV